MSNRLNNIVYHIDIIYHIDIVYHIDIIYHNSVDQVIDLILLINILHSIFMSIVLHHVVL